jgi:hypothetical protein
LIFKMSFVLLFVFWLSGYKDVMCSQIVGIPPPPLVVQWALYISGARNRPFPLWVKFWSRYAWTKISSQLERASQN